MYANGGRVDCEVSNRGTICNTASSITSFYGEIKNTGDRAVVSGGIYYGTLADGMTAGKTVTYKNGDAVFAVQMFRQAAEQHLLRRLVIQEMCSRDGGKQMAQGLISAQQLRRT